MAAGLTYCRVHPSSLGCGVYGDRTPFTQTCRCLYAALAIVVLLLHSGHAMCAVAGGSHCWCSC